MVFFGRVELRLVLLGGVLGCHLFLGSLFCGRMWLKFVPLGGVGGCC